MTKMRIKNVARFCLGNESQAVPCGFYGTWVSSVKFGLSPVVGAAKILPAQEDKISVSQYLSRIELFFDGL
jgi:hypothetical protein